MLPEGVDSWFEEAESSFVDWAKQNAIPITSLVPTQDNSDLEQLAELIGDSSFVALSEGFHNCKEMMELHYRIVRYLIENHGFNTVLTESGLPESRMIYDYVQGKEAGDGMWESGLNKMYGAWKEGRDLIEFIREYNIEHGNVLQYYGTDIGGFYQNWKRPLENIMTYLETVDDDLEYVVDLKTKLDPYMELLATSARLNYSEKLSLTEKNELAVILDETVAHFNENEDSYVTKSNKEDFEWARQSMISMQLAENYYRNYENRKNPENSKYVGLNGREIAMARNSLWVFQKMRKDAKVIWIDHVIHTKTKSQYQDDVWGFFTLAGQILKQSLGDNFFAIGMAYGGGKFWNKWQKPSDRFMDSVPPCDNKTSPSLENSLKKCFGNRNFILPWGNVSKGSKAETWKRTSFSLRENDYFIRMEPDEWDCCIYLDTVNPATQA